MAQKVSPPQQVTLLFVHGAGLCRQAWNPIVRRLSQAPQLCGVSFKSIDLPFHGENRDESVPPRIYYVNGEETNPRVAHPGNSWSGWASAAVYKAVKQIRSTSPLGSVIVGIGHSMGASALWKTEAEHPGSFGGLVLFEPIYGPNYSNVRARFDFLASITLQRESQWPSKKAARDHFHRWKNFSSWDRESLDAWFDGAVVPATQNTSKIEEGPVTLACAPAIEASIYCGWRLWFTEEQRATPRCKIVLENGGRSRIVDLEWFEQAAEQFPETYTVRTPIPNLSHTLVMEDPDACTAAILADLATFPIFNTTSKL